MPRRFLPTRLRTRLAVTALACIATSWLLWGKALSSLAPPPPPPTPREIDFGFHVDAQTAALLDRRLPSPFILDATLGDAIDRLRDSTQARIFVNWRGLGPVGINKDTHVSIEVSGMPLGQALRALLAKVGAPKARLDCRVDEGVIVVSTHSDLARSASTRVYDVRDFAGGFLRLPKTGPKPPLTPSDSARLIRQIQGSIDPDSWRANGGQAGAIKYLVGQLIITQTELNQRETPRLLHRLRQQRLILAVTLRAAILTVSSLGVVAALHLLARSRARRAIARAGLCRHCGYDLRASPQRCPECGTAIDVASPGMLESKAAG